jgi:hypothetical protein
MTECIHGLESGCTICLIPWGTLRGKILTSPKPYGKALDLSKAAEIPVRRVPEDRDVAMAMAVAAGVRCPKCLTDTTGRGCACQRRQCYDDDMARATRFLQRAVDEAGLTPREAAGMAFSTMSRAARLGSLTDDDKAADRLDIIVDFEVKPQYLKARRTEQNILPI